MDQRPSLTLLLMLALALALPVSGAPPQGTDLAGRILSANHDSDTMLLEGDLVVPRTRNAMVCMLGGNSCLWPKNSAGLVEVPYTIEERGFSPADKAKIQSAILAFHQNTCIRFVSRVNQANYIRYVSMRGCYSMMGRIGGEQIISVNSAGCIFKGIIQHETLHALGFQHEHTRSDRDQYVTINWSNIDPSDADNFNKQNTNNLNTPYDYTSVMHYGNTAFSINGKQTIATIPNPNVPIGQRDQMSVIDILRVNKLYDCNRSEA